MDSKISSTPPNVANTTQIQRYRDTLRRRTNKLYYRISNTYVYSLFPLLNLLVILAEMVALAHLVNRYNAQFEKRPIITMMVTNTILNGIADTVAQTVTAVRRRGTLSDSPADAHKHPKLEHEIELLERKLEKLPHPGSELIPTDNRHHAAPLPPPFDFERLARFAGWGMIIAPFQFKWLALLNKTFPLATGSATVQAVKRVACDQFVFAPISLVGFFSYMTLAEGQGTDGVKRKLQQAYAPTLKANYMLWPAVQLLNFRVVPLQFQLPFASTIGIAWGTYLSLANSDTE